MRLAYRTLIVLIAAQTVIQAMLVAAFVAGLNRWIATEGRVGVANPGAMDSLDPDANGFVGGILDQAVLRSAPRWLDLGPVLAVQTVLATVVGPVLAVLLILVAYRWKAREALVRARIVFGAVALQAACGLALYGPLFELAAFTVVGTALYAWLRASPSPDRADVRAYAAVAAAVAGLIVLQELFLGLYISEIGSYVSESGHNIVYEPLQYHPGSLGIGIGLAVFTAIQRYLLPAATVVLLGVAVITRTPANMLHAGTVLLSTALGLVLAVLGPQRPLAAAGYELVTFATFALALRPAHRVTALAVRQLIPPAIPGTG